MFETVLRKVLTDKRVYKIPILFVTQIIIVLEEMDLLRKDIEDDVPNFSTATDYTR